MQVGRKLISILVSLILLETIYYGISSDMIKMVSSENIITDNDGDGRPDEFEIDQGLDEAENDIAWTFLVYCCGDDVPQGEKIGTLLPEMWEFIERLSWVGNTDSITLVVQFDGTDQLNGNHQDMFWNDIPNNMEKPDIAGTSTRRFLVGHDSMGWDPSIILQEDCTNNTLIDLYDVTDWDPKNTGKSHSSLEWEANMADPHTLFEFISWGMDTFTSDNYCLYIDSHGDGIHGFGYDHRPDQDPTTTVKDLMELEEIRTVADLLSQEEPPKELDIVMLQSCLMGNLEFCTEFSSFSRYYVASENLMHLTGNQDDKVLEKLDKDPSWSPSRLAREFIDVENFYSRDGITDPPWNIMDWNGNERLTFSSSNNSFLTTTDLLYQIRKMNTAILNGSNSDPGFYLPHLRDSFSPSNTDHYTNELGYIQIDYCSFLEYWTYLEGPDDGILSSIRDLSSNISKVLWNSDPNRRVIEYEKHDTGYFYKTLGIAVYCPSSGNEWLSARSFYDKSTFGERTLWGSILDLLHKNHPPLIEHIDKITAYPDETVYYTFNATDFNRDRVEVSINWTDTPFTLIIADYLSISFIANEEQTGVYPVLLKFEDGNGSHTDHYIEIEILPFNIPPVIEPVPIQNAYVDEEFHYQLHVSDENMEDFLSQWCESSINGNCWIDDDLILHIMPDEQDIGYGSVKIFLSDNNGSVVNITIIFNIMIRNLPPEGPDQLHFQVEAGDLEEHILNYSDPDGDMITIESTYGLPDWLGLSYENDLIINMHPMNDDLGSWEFTINLLDSRGGILEVSISIEILTSSTPHLLLSNTITLVERGDYDLELGTDYERNGTVQFEIISGREGFIHLQNNTMVLTPKDGDHGIYSLKIKTSIVGGAFSYSEHIILVEYNLSTLEVDVTISPEEEVYFVGDEIHVEFSYSGYDSSLDLRILFLEDGDLISSVNGSFGKFILQNASEFQIIIDLKDRGPQIDPIKIKVEEKQKKGDDPGISPILILIIALIIITGVAVVGLLAFLRFKKEKRELHIESDSDNGPEIQTY